MYKRDWEDVSASTSRMKVPLGWIVSKYTWRDAREGTGCSISIVFIFDPFNFWKLEEKKKS